MPLKKSTSKDAAFRERLRASIERNRKILKRLAFAAVKRRGDDVA